MVYRVRLISALKSNGCMYRGGRRRGQGGGGIG